eukprot:TRINITY_DN3812_c0_g2_i1.p1 TRINITY_DN3812_c0_g2~~TRINITY_DN3812_c0_g2_i1.p1  ORF type:complete len:479 (+),score=48.52 TRINITY_DN3812_c0_g2_i1:64-1500(+)
MRGALCVCVCLQLAAAASVRSSSCAGATLDIKRYAREVVGALRDGASAAAAGKRGPSIFVHVPRTSGLSLLSCFFHLIYRKNEVCGSGYSMDKQWLNASDRTSPISGHCKFGASHLDSSVLVKLARHGRPATAALSVWRDPVDRVISSYELALYNAVSQLQLEQNPGARDRQRKIKRLMQEANATSFPVPTVDVWPWRHLVRHMRADLLRRNGVRLFSRRSAEDLVMHTYGSPYNLTRRGKKPVMPLHEWIEQPVVRDTVHNLGALQVIGATNVTLLQHAAARRVRVCVRESVEAREELRRQAETVLRHFTHVGLTNEHGRTLSLFAHEFKANLNRPALSGGSMSDATVVRSDSRRSTFARSTRRTLDQEICHCERRRQRYMARLQRHREDTFSALLSRLLPSGGTRGRIPAAVRNRIRELNSVDDALHRVAQELFDAKENAAGRSGSLPPCERIRFRLDCKPRIPTQATDQEVCGFD